MTTRYIKYDDETGRVTNIVLDKDPGPDWTSVPEGDWPDTTPGEGETIRYNYDPSAGVTAVVIGLPDPPDRY